MCNIKSVHIRTNLDIVDGFCMKNSVTTSGIVYVTVTYVIANTVTLLFRSHLPSSKGDLNNEVPLQ